MIISLLYVIFTKLLYIYEVLKLYTLSLTTLTLPHEKVAWSGSEKKKDTHIQFTTIFTSTFVTMWL